ncbi:MAG: HD domain-containing protein [bacterium]|nr:HD domain-containing protein [bacterium]
MNEEQMLNDALGRSGIKEEHQAFIRKQLRILWEYHEPTARHSIRVGVLFSRIAEFLGLDAKAALWPGLLHDIGKGPIDPDVLTKTEKFTEEDYKIMEPHVMNGWNMLQSIFDWTAQIMVRHHQFGKRPYPAVLPVPSPNYTEETNAMFNRYARLLALADYYDALMYRDNAKHGSVPLSPAQKRALYLQDNDDQKELILELERAGILQFFVCPP